MIPAEQVHAALEKILASEQFSNAPRLARFLRFAVEKALAGDGGDLKEYLLGTEVFDRGSDFDPRMDPIVRVEARSLRTKLDEYYASSGQADFTRIVFRKGSYAPTFEAASTEPAPSRRFWRWGLAGAALATALAGAILVRNATPPPVIAVLPWAEASELEFANGLGEAVAAELSRNSAVRVVAWTNVLAYRATHPGSINQEMVISTRDLGGTVALALPVRRSGDRLRITALLIRTEHGWKEWASEYERGGSDTFAMQRELARAISDDLARVLR